MGRKRDKHESQQPPDRRVLPEPPPGFDIGAHYLRQMTELYNRGVLQFGDVDKFLIITRMESQAAVLQNLEGSMTHDCLPLDDILKAEPDYLRRIGLATPPGPGYARCTLYDLSRPEYPVATAWFNPLLRGAKCLIPGDQPATSRFGAHSTDTRSIGVGLPDPSDYPSYEEWNAEVLRRTASPAVLSPDIFDKLARYTGISDEQLDRVGEQLRNAGGGKVEVDENCNEFCLSKVTLTLPDGKTFTGVSCTQENFTRAIDLLEGVFTGEPGGEAHRASAEDLQPIRDAKHLPYVVRGTLTEPIFRLFDVKGDTMSLAVQGLARRMGF